MSFGSSEQQATWELSLGKFLREAVQRNPDKVFLQIVGQQITYGEFYSRVRQAAAMFANLGVQRGDRVCLFLPNVPEFHYCWFGLSLLGAISVPVNVAYKRDEAAYIFDNTGATAVVTHLSLLDVAEAASAISPTVKHKLLATTELESEAFQPPVEPPATGWLNLDDLLAESEEMTDLPEVSTHEISMLVYTSGTTGNPKGVQVTHLMYVAAGQGFAHWTEANEADRFFTCLPFFHANAQYYSTMGSLAAGATLVVAERFSASRFWDQVREANATVVNFIGMMMPVLAKQPESELDRQNNVRLFYGSPAFSPDFLEAFKARFGTEIIVGFGMTETCYGSIEKIGQQRRPNSSGQPRLHPDSGFVNRIRIVDDDGRPVSSGQPGEITISNPAVMPGYWRNQEQTDLALREGWLHTGDLGWADEEGFLYFVDRKKDVIRRRGENISSQEVEDAIKRHPTVLDCAVIAVPSELGEDEVKAYVTPRPPATVDPETIVRWCAENLAYFKVPRYIEVREEMPRTPSLRVRKDLLRQEREDLIEGCFDREAAGIRIR
ncbi:MAG: ATP-dependent acyl-CoA ligase [Chloroflexota bacterium]|nr:ATP-dependent acyl-CoA ligase [Chloroflexota bacterium]